jgi:hypothetical protein
LDFANLRRGDRIAASRVEVAVLLSRKHNATCDEDCEGCHYWRSLLRLRDKVVDAFLERGDVGVIVTTHDQGLQILTDEEAVHYVQARGGQAQRHFKWAVTKGRLIDRQKLSDASRESLDRWLHVASFRLQQMRKHAPPLLTDHPPDLDELPAPKERTDP